MAASLKDTTRTSKAAAPVVSGSRAKCLLHAVQ
jgi:hypothetical protein